MKLILALITLSVTFAAHAEAWYTNNKSGGQIIITDGNCYLVGKQYDALKKGYSRMPDGTTLYGCWYYEDKIVYMTYEDGTQYTYPVNFFSRMN